MKQFLIISFCFFVSTTIFSQNYIPYYNLVNEAEYWLYKEEYNKAKQLYLKAFSLEKPMGKDAYLLAKCYALEGNKVQCLHWLEVSTTIPVSFAPYLLRKADQYPIFQAVFPENGELEALIQDLLLLKETTDNKYKDSTYRMLQDTVNALVKQDQKYRKVGNLSHFTTEDWRLFKENDSIVQTALLNLTQQYGYPGYSHVGTDIGDLILVHVSAKKMYQRYETLLYEAIKKGHLHPFGYAYMADRWHLHQSKSCYLFMRIYTRKLCSETDYTAIAKRRLKIGLSIYFKGPRKRASEPYDLQPWVKDEFVKAHSLLD